MALLTEPPKFVHDFVEIAHFDEDETVVGFFADTKPVPGDPFRVEPKYWVVVTNKGLYYLDPALELCIRAKSVHPFN